MESVTIEQSGLVEIVSNEAESVFWESDLKNISDTEERKLVARLLNRSRG